MIEWSRVRFSAGAVGKIISPVSNFCADTDSPWAAIRTHENTVHAGING